MSFLIRIGFLIALAMFPVQAAAQSACTTMHLAQFMAMFESQNKTAKRTLLSGIDKAVFIANYNKYPPRSDVPTENTQVITYTKDGAASTYIIVAVGMCVRRAGPVPTGLFKKLLMGDTT